MVIPSSASTSGQPQSLSVLPTSRTVAMAVPTYDGPKCHTCVDLMPNEQFPLGNGKWVDYRAQGRKNFSLDVFVEKVRGSADKGCNNCAIIVEALDSVEGGRVELDNDFLSIMAKLGGTLDMSYEVNEELRYIQVFARQGGTGNAIGPAPVVATKMNPSLAATRARSLLDECRDSHPACGVAEIPPMPRRVVYLGSDDGMPRLIETGERGTRESYIALSYCWGLAQTLTTTKETYAARTAGIPWDAIPKTLGEAMEFAVALGVPYIWIDALCIRQDDAADWASEAAKMKDVYENALLTLSATSAPDVSAGVFLPRTKLTHRLHAANVSARRPCNTTHEKLFAYANDHARDMESYPAMSRGWIFQERLLSRRMLYCAHDEIIWECRAGITCECSGAGHHGGPGVNAVAKYKRQDWMPPPPPPPSGGPHGVEGGGRDWVVMSMWMELLTAYTHREFTQYSDRLVAISGIAKKFAPLAGLGRYLGGVWEEFLPAQLAWARFPGERARASRRLGGPTWSWGSVDQPVAYQQVIPWERVRTSFKLVHSLVVLKTEDPTGPVEMARLTISGPRVNGRLKMRPNRLAENDIYYMTYAGQGHADSLEVFVSIEGKEYLMTADVCQWGSAAMRAEMQPEEVLGNGDGVSCVELYQTVDGDPDNIARGVGGDVSLTVRFPWLVLRWSKKENAYRRVGLIDWSNREDYKSETQPLGAIISRAERRRFDIV
ncbi:heterokaryon incompatibility protein-domain-containing protein [Lasiosphaeris hirsuta]|uniref:Heterokaryon incompatibility protein-domain-containing protein n=1 Tax=Lasiosphaeris hirsuta TaxID=260670 RepID=A0AA40ANU6_9PEZI|nr:heterokaryon incompatibility protein-domain-containing protein [Lasiosphaeris hirsuta]